MTETLKIQIPIYKTSLQVFFGTADECIEAQRKDGRSERDIDDWRRHNAATSYAGAFHMGDDTYNLIWLCKWPESVGEFGDLVHEIEHAVFYILDSRGLKHTEESDEAYAYLSSFLFCEIDSYIAKENEKNGR